MSALLLLHITAILSWSAVLLYLPALIAAITNQQTNFNSKAQSLIPRVIFNLLLTPAALLAIITGTLIFLKMQTIDFWLLIKLTLVSFLIVCHALNGWLILKKESLTPKKLKVTCMSLATLSATLIFAIFWIVLAKPQQGVLFW